jgi:hypothetical protein
MVTVAAMHSFELAQLLKEVGQWYLVQEEQHGLLLPHSDCAVLPTSPLSIARNRELVKHVHVQMLHVWDHMMTLLKQRCSLTPPRLEWDHLNRQ